MSYDSKKAFQNKDLSNYDFSEHHDIRGLDFSGFNLTNANFSGVVAGSKRHIKILLLIIFIVSTIIFTILLEFAGQRTGDRFIYHPTGGTSPDEYSINLWIAIFTVSMYLTSAVIIHRGVQIAFQVTFGLGVSGIFLTLGHVVIRASTRFLYFSSGEAIAIDANRVIAPTVTSAITGVALLILSLGIAIAMTSAKIVGGSKFHNIITSITFVSALFVGFFIYQSGNHPVTSLVSCLIGLLGVYLGWKISFRALKNDNAFYIVKSIAVVFSSIKGTSFKNANLSYADFSNAQLSSTDFRQTNLEHDNLNQTRWQGSTFLDYSRFGNTILDNRTVRELLRTGEGYRKDYERCNLKGAYLVDVNLEQANLTEADISNANLKGANLKGANLKKAQALGTNFYEADLTGACLEAWNINSVTQLKGSFCKYIYLLNNGQDKCPSSGVFKNDEFGKLFQKVISTVDFIFRNGVDWQAFLTSFEQVRIENQEVELEIQSIENKGDDVIVIKVNVPPDVSKEDIHSSFINHYEVELARLSAYYEAALMTKNEEISRQANNMKEIIQVLASQPRTQMNFHGPVVTAIGTLTGNQIIYPPE